MSTIIDRLAKSLGPELRPDEEIGRLIESMNIKKKLEVFERRKFLSVEVISYKTLEIQGGRDYFTKVRIVDNKGQESFMHLRIRKGPCEEPSIPAYESDKGLEDEITYFEDMEDTSRLNAELLARNFT